jgi:hypothetical protein
MVILLGLFAAVPSASAHNGHRHGRHIQHFLVLSSDPSDSATPVIVATGPIHAKGTDIVVSDTRDTFKFPDGALSIRHHAKKKSIKDSSDPVTCYFKHTERGTYTVTGGTGAYANAHGHGHYSVRVSAVGCDENAPPEFFSFEIRASGPLHF